MRAQIISQGLRNLLPVSKIPATGDFSILADMRPLKILFLDHDSVMSTELDCNYMISRDNWMDKIPFDVECVKVLNRVIVETDCEIVVTSDWRTHHGLEDMRQWYMLNGVCKVPIGVTARLRKFNSMDLERNRAAEIDLWIEQHHIRCWCAVDDMDMGPHLDYFVHCGNDRLGLSDEGVGEKIIKLLT